MARTKKRSDGRYKKTLTVAGKRKYFYGKTQKEAEEKAYRFLYGESNESVKFKTVIESWERVHYENLSPKTVQGYMGICKNLTTRFGDTSIKDISTKQIENWLKVFCAKKSHKTATNYLSILHIIFEYAIQNEYCDSNPTDRVNLRYIGKKPTTRRALTNKEIQLIDKNKDTLTGFFAYFLLYTGLRRGEALALQYKDIDFDKKVIHITKSAYYIGNKAQIKPPKTDNGIRDVVLLDRVAKLIPHGRPDDYIFNDGNPAEPKRNKRVETEWAKWRDEIGLAEEITPHYMRHTYATILNKQKVDVKTAQHLLGHADIRTTMNIYTHIEQSMLDTALQQLNIFKQF